MARLVFLLPLLLAAEGPALAEPAAKPPAVGKTVEGVTVTAAPQQGLRTGIDRRSYGITNDLQTTTGSIGDALRNIPSVEVDVQGGLSLRGDPNVTIMIDGKPSGLFKGDGRGLALQNLPADQFERVEVITNPSAEFKPDGSGGIINLISKKGRRAGYSGSIRANLGSEARYNGGASGAYNSGKLSLSADVSLRHDPQKFDITRAGVAATAGGGHDVSAYRLAQRGQGHILSAHAAADYDLDPKTRIGAEARASRMQIDIDSFERQTDVDDAGGLLRAYERRAPNPLRLTNTEGALSYRHDFAGDGHQLTLNLSRERTDFDNRRDARVETLVPASLVFEDLDYETRRDETEFKTDYVRPLGEAAKLKLGYDLTDEDFVWNKVGARGPAPDALRLDPALVDRFRYGQLSHAVYGSYERGLGDLTVQAGLRLEAVRLTFDQVTLGTRSRRHTFDAYPTLHLAYRLDDTQRLTASYSRRIVRPRPEDLDPFLQYVDASQVRQGDTHLKPQLTDSYEAAYEYRKGQTYYLATLAYRDTRHLVTNVISSVGDGVFLTSRRNLGQRQSLVLELVANGRLTTQLTYNLSSTIAYNRIDAANLGFQDRRHGASVGGRATLNWQATRRDLVQANGSLYARQLQPQGHQRAAGILNLGYRHKVTDDLAILVTANDVLDSTHGGTVLDTPALQQRSTFRGNVRSVFVGAVWSFGGAGKRKPEPAFEFGAGGGPPS
ncbi:MAG: TonB-dependent receptor [Caulobacterales bacterium]|nr:TonB-dependent receptor [Caulobacterales bacterium]